MHQWPGDAQDAVTPAPGTSSGKTVYKKRKKSRTRRKRSTALEDSPTRGSLFELAADGEDEEQASDAGQKKQESTLIDSRAELHPPDTKGQSVRSRRSRSKPQSPAHRLQPQQKSRSSSTPPPDSYSVPRTSHTPLKLHNPSRTAASHSRDTPQFKRKRSSKRKKVQIQESDGQLEDRTVSSIATSPTPVFEDDLLEQYTVVEQCSDAPRTGFGSDADWTPERSEDTGVEPLVRADLLTSTPSLSSILSGKNKVYPINIVSHSSSLPPAHQSLSASSLCALSQTTEAEDTNTGTMDSSLAPESPRDSLARGYDEYRPRRRRRDVTSAASRHAHSINVDLTSLPDVPIQGDGNSQGMELLEGVGGGDGGGGGDQPAAVGGADVMNLTLHQCARDGDEYNMKILLRHLGSSLKKKINQYDEDDLTPLHYAARYNFLGVVKLLVESGADVNKRGDDDVTPLHHAARYRRERTRRRDTAVDPGADDRVMLNLKNLAIRADLAAQLHAEAREEEETVEGEEEKKEENEEEEEEEEDEAGEEAKLKAQSRPEGPGKVKKPGLNGIPLLDQYESEFGQAQESVILYLVSKGAHVNCCDIYGQTPLHFAAMRGNEVACKDLLSVQGVDIEAQDKQGICPMHMAAIHDQVEISKMLLEAGANIRCIDSEQSTPLHYACTEGNVQLVQELFDCGARTAEAWVMISNMVTDQDVEGSTCLHLAVDNGHFEVAKMCLERRAEVNRPRKHYMYPLHLAAMSGDIRIVRLLVENSARIDVVNDEQATALHRAAILNHTEVAKFLVDRGARINRRDKDNYTPLLLAASYGHVEMVELLLQKGADYTAVDKYDKTAIYLAAEENKLPVLEKLLSYPQVQRLINVSDQYDASPLHIAAQEGYLDIVKVLLSNGADLDMKNEEEQTPCHLAAKHGRTNIVREIVRRDKSVLNDEDDNSNTGLHLAAQYGHHKVADVLLELGADVSARNYNQWTPLDLAASKGWTKTCAVLLDNDAPVDPTDKNKTTPLHLAARYGHPRVVDLLLDWEADVTLEDTEGNNCLDLAIENNHSNVALQIINSDVWQQALRNSTEDPATGRIDTPMRKLVKKMPDVAEKVFDRCLSYGQEKNPEHPGYEITFNYEFLDDTYMPWIHESYRKRMRSDDATSISDTSSMGSAFDDDDHLTSSARPYTTDSNFLKKNHPLFIMVSSEREILLDHPLVTSLLNHKWSTFGRFFYYLSLLIYCIFLTFLTGYIVLTNPPQDYNATDRSKIENNDCTNLVQSYDQGLFSKIGTYVIIALAAFNLLKELLQIYQAKLAYLGWTNLIEWTTYVTALLLVISFNECQRTTGYRYEWQWSVGAISIFLGWINLVLFIQKFPQLGIYVVMFTDVLYTFVQFFIVFFLFIVAFALAFYTVLQQQEPFDDVPSALIKTSVMMIGEFEFDEIFNSDTNQLFYPAVSYILFVAFLIIMSILLMNLLVGLAVDDIKAVQEQAALKRMAMQVELALDVERVIPDFIRRKAFVKRKTLKPNMYMFSNPVSRFFYSHSGITTRSLQEHLNPELDEIEKVQENQEKLSNDVKKLKRNVKDLKETSQRIESMLRAVIRANSIEWQDEDYQEDDEVDQIHAGLSY